jgi:hypothetical protein
MRHFYRSHLDPSAVLAKADAFFPTIGLARNATSNRARTFAGEIGTVTVSVKMEGGHHTFVEAHTDQMGESRLDRNVKKYFLQLHKLDDPTHALEASY